MNWNPFSKHGAVARVDRKAGRNGSLPYPTYGSSGGAGGYAYWQGALSGMLPGAEFDYVREAGDLWKNAVVAACINLLMCVACEPQLVVMQTGSDGREKELVSHPLLDLLQNPNEDDDDLNSLVQSFILDWTCHGTAYYYLLRGGSGQVVGIQPVPKKQLVPVADPSGARRTSGYAYWVDGQWHPVAREDVVPFRFGRNPDNIREGFPPLLASCRDICGENELATLGAAIASNMGIPSYYIGPDSTDPKTRLDTNFSRKLRSLWRDRFGKERRGEVFVSDTPIKIERLGFSPDELMADKSRAIAVSRICAALRIDPMVIGLPSESKTYANLREAHRALYDHNVVPTGNAYTGRLTRTFRRERGFLQPNERLAYSYRDVAALQEDRNDLYKRVVNAYDKGVLKRKDARRELGEQADDTLDDVYITDLKPLKLLPPGKNETDPAEDEEDA